MPEWSKGGDLRSSVSDDAWVRTPLHALKYFRSSAEVLFFL